MLLFLDCEFTDCWDIDHIGIGMMSDAGRHEFYVERTDFRREACSEFVRMAMLQGAEPPAAANKRKKGR